MIKFLQLSENEWINLDKIDSFWLNDYDEDSYHQNRYGIEFKCNGYDEYGVWFDSKKERDKFLDKLKFYFGGWL